MRASLCKPEQIADMLRSVLAGKPNPQQELTLAILTDGNCYQVQDEHGQQVGAYVLRGQGSEVWIQAAAGKGKIDFCDLFDDLIAKHGAGFETMAFRTQRRGLVAKALRRGFEITDKNNGYTLRKFLK